MLKFHCGSSPLSIDDGAHSLWMLHFSCRLYLYPFGSFESDLLSYSGWPGIHCIAKAVWLCDLCTSAPEVAGVTGLSPCPALTLGFEILWLGKTMLGQNSKKMEWNWTWKMAEIWKWCKPSSLGQGAVDIGCPGAFAAGGGILAVQIGTEKDVKNLLCAGS